MTPIRIIVLAILLFILYRLITGPRRKKFPTLKTGKDDNSTERDILVEDPVCHSYVPKKEAIRRVKKGKTYYFCSESCAQTFLKDD